MSLTDHYKITHRIVSSEEYTYFEVLEMLPYERDIFYSLLQDDAAKAAQKNVNQPQFNSGM